MLFTIVCWSQRIFTSLYLQARLLETGIPDALLVVPLGGLSTTLAPTPAAMQHPWMPGSARAPLSETWTLALRKRLRHAPLRAAMGTRSCAAQVTSTNP